MLMMMKNEVQGILLINKPKGKTSFSLVATLRKILNVQKIGHAGTLDPFATGVMVMLIGRNYTRLSDQFLLCDKEYLAQVHLGISTDTFDCDGVVLQKSDIIPTEEQIKDALAYFQGEIDQIPPMFSAKKVNGQKLYDLARKGKTIERESVRVTLTTRLINYTYPHLVIAVSCSKGTYIRSIAEELGNKLGCGAHLSNLQRTRSGTYRIEDCFDGMELHSPSLNLEKLHQKIKQVN
jgi:tRNA pseudouridine55 synthase